MTPASRSGGFLDDQAEPSPKSRRGSVLVAGGGIGGLAAAVALAQAGFEVEVHEQRPAFREEGGAIAVYENLARALDALGALEDATASADLKNHFEYRDHRGRQHAPAGRHLSGGRYYYVSRYDVHRALLLRAEAAGVRCVADSSVVSADPDGRISLADGGQLHADLVVVADGVASSLRAGLGLRVRVNRLKHWGLREPLDFPLEQAPPGHFYERWNGTKRIGYGRLGGDQSATFLSGNLSDLADDGTAIDTGKWVRAFPDLEVIIRHVGERRPKISLLSEVICTPWSSGRCVLIGDAAHSMPPHLGQGAAMAVQDAVYLGIILRRLGNLGELDALQRALRQWEADDRPVVRRVQRNAVLYCRAQGRWPRQLLALRPVFFRTVSKRIRRVDLHLLEHASDLTRE